jgi:hypothetical protein
MPSRSPSRAAPPWPFRPLLGLLLAALLGAACFGQAGCSGGGGSTTTAIAVDTGSVAIVVTDGPSDDFCGIPVTITEVLLLSDAGPVSLFEGRKTVDLLRLQDNTNLLTVGRRVPAGDYSKIRLVVPRLQLEECDEHGNVVDVIEVDHPSQKIDLVPRGGFTVRPGDLLLVQLDLDAEKSIKAHATGNGRYRFRPVVFVDVFTGRAPNRLVGLEGVIEQLDRQTGRFSLCRTHAVSQPVSEDGGERTTRDTGPDDPSGGDPDACVEIVVDPDTSIFDTGAVPASLEALENGDPAAVLGRFLRAGEQLRVGAEVVQRDPESVERVRGRVLGAVMDDDLFDYEIDPEQSDAPGAQAEVLVQRGTKVFARDGTELTLEDLEAGQRARVVGAIDDAEAIVQIAASFVMLNERAERPDRSSGAVRSWDEALRELTIETDGGASACAHIPLDARVFLASVDANESRIDFLPVEPAALPVGGRVDLFGRDEVGCFAAELVIGFAGFDDD